MAESNQFSFAAGADQVGAQVSKLLARRLPPAGAPWETDLISVRPAGGGSMLFASRCTATGQKVAIKVYRQPLRGLIEYRATRKAMRRDVPVIRPLLGDGKLGIFVSEWTEGDTLQDAFRKGTLGAVLPQVGEWLRRLHTTQSILPRPRRAADVLVPLRGRAAAWASGVSGAEHTQFRSTLAAVAQAASRMRRGIHRSVLLHGDAVPRNFLITPQGPVGLDLGGSRMGPREYDLAKLTVVLLLEAEIAGRSGALEGESAREALLSSYGLTSDVARAWLGLWEAMELLGRWDQALSRMATRPAPAAKKAEAVRSLLARRGW